MTTSKKNTGHFRLLFLLVRGVGPGGQASVGERQRHAQPRVFALVAFVEVQSDAEALQTGIRVRRQHKKKSLHEILQKGKKKKPNHGDINT